MSDCYLTLLIVKCESGARLCSKTVHTAAVRCIRFLSSTYILTGSDDNTAVISSVSNLRKMAELTHHHKGIMGSDICKDYIALASEDCTASVYESPFKYTTK